MNPSGIESLAQFCAEQFSTFDLDAWIDRSSIDCKAVAVAAKYLSMTSWYGHEDELERFATWNDSKIISISCFHREAQAIGLSLTSLSARVRLKIALQRQTFVRKM